MTCVIHCYVSVSLILDRGKLREERLTWTRFRGFQSIVLGKAQQSSWQREFVVEAASITVSQETELRRNYG